MANLLANCLDIAHSVRSDADSRLDPIHASVQDLKNGKYCTGPKNGMPGIISSVKMSKTGKHGHAKFTFNLKYPFTGTASQEMWPGHTHLVRPDVRKYEWAVTNYDASTGDIDAMTMDDECTPFQARLPADFEMMSGNKVRKLGEEFLEAYEEWEESGAFDIVISVTEGPVKDPKGKHFYVMQVTDFKKKEPEEN